MQIRFPKIPDNCFTVCFTVLAFTLTFDAIKSAWTRVENIQPFEFNFVDPVFQKNYVADARLEDIIGYFTLVAISISCLGLMRCPHAV